jgi:hypothetical protein
MSYLFEIPLRRHLNQLRRILRLAMGFSVHVLRSRNACSSANRRTQIERDTEADRHHLEELMACVTDTIQHMSAGVRPRVTEYSDSIRGKAKEVVESGLQALEQALIKELAEAAQNIKLERKSSLGALEMLLLHYDLPEATETIRVRLSEGGRYSAWLESVTPYGLETVVELSIPAESPFAHDARVDRFVEGLEIRAPETAGWIRKESRMVPQKLGRLHIVEIAIGEQSLIKLRSSPEAQANGYDISLRTEDPPMEVVRISKDADGSGPFDPEPSDIPNVLRLRDKLEEASRALATKRRAITSARVAEQPIEESPGMRSVIEKLLLVLAPMVREIAAHSMSPNELVLRRMMGDDRREEIAVTKAELRANPKGSAPRPSAFDPLSSVSRHTGHPHPRPAPPSPAAGPDDLTTKCHRVGSRARTARLLYPWIKPPRLAILRRSAPLQRRPWILRL